MGSKCSASYANLFMNNFEETWIYKLIRKNSNFYKRFIDDIFILWNGTREQLKEFIEQINTVHPTIKFEANYSFNSINFLDTHIYKNKNRKLCTTLHVKPTDRQSYLHHKSYHPTASKRSITYSQALRIRKICTEDSEYLKHSKNLVQILNLRRIQAKRIGRHHHQSTQRREEATVTTQT